jgi:hypothetical protein
VATRSLYDQRNHGYRLAWARLWLAGKERRMSSLTVLRRGRLAGAVIPALAIAIAGLVVASSGAQAAPRTPAHPAQPARPALHGGPKVALGATTNVFANVFNEGPDGSLYYSRGATVYRVTGNGKPKVEVHASHTVMAVAANQSDLFVQTGLTVTEYRLSNASAVKHWTLSSPVKPITSAGLLAVGSTVWSWTDWGTDESGFEFATVSRIATSGSAAHVISKAGYPDQMSANASGLYFESNSTKASANFLNHVTPSGVVKARKLTAEVGTPLALSGGRVDLLIFGSHLMINTYSATTLALLSSKKVSINDDTIAGTNAGLLVLAQVCHGRKCSTPTVSKLNASTGAASGAVKLPGAAILLPGPSAGVIEVNHLIKGNMTLQRLS